jgi:hypothetical protein
MKISATIVTYKNNIDILKQTIDSCLNSELEVKLYIVDNSCEDSIRQLCVDSCVEYIPMKSNIGFGAAHNVIMNDKKKLGTYHLVLNPDIRFEKGVLEKIFEFMQENPDIGNLMPKIIYPNGEIQHLCKLLPTPRDWFIRMFIPIKKIKDQIDYNLEMKFSDYNQIMDVPYLSGCFMFLRTDVIKKIGVFDEGIFMYGEDTDLNRRIFKNYRTVYFPIVTVIHDFEKGSHKSFRLLWIHIKAAIYYMNKWGWFFDKERTKINKQIKEKYK